MGPKKFNLFGDAGLEERRSSTRFLKDPESESAVVWVRPGREELVGVHDESLHGICLVMHDVADFKVGVIATIIYHADVLDSTVRRIEQLPSGEFLVGFECFSETSHPRSSPRQTDGARDSATAIAARPSI